MSLRSKGRPLAAATALVSGLALIAPATASAHQSHHSPLAVQQVNLVSDQQGKASLQDDDLVNPWGLSLGATTPLWVVQQRYVVVHAVLVRARLDHGDQGAHGPGDRAGSDRAGQQPRHRVRAHQRDGERPGSVHLRHRDRADRGLGTAGLAADRRGRDQGHDPGRQLQGTGDLSDRGDRLFAANFAQGRIDVFDTTFTLVRQPRWAFRDFHLPKGYAPFNVQTLNGRVFVAYAKVDPKTGEEKAGRGLGFVDEYTVDGKFVTRVASRGTLNAPWGLALAPTAWGLPAGTLLVGNFGDGRITVFQPKSHYRFQSAGLVRNSHGNTLVIDGLWALLQGTATTGGTDALWFSAGPDDETHGLIGVLRKP